MGDTVLRLCLISALLAGCGNVSSKTADAAVDSGPDADLSGNATVVTQAALFGAKVGDPAGNIDVVSHLPNNMVLATGMTDASGNATIKVYPGGSVTAVYKHTADMGADLITWLGVKPGDNLTFGSRQFSFTGTSVSLGAPTYSWPALAGVTSFQVFTSCGGTSAGAAATSLTLTESTFCHRDPMDVLFRAFNGSALVGYNFRSNVVFNPAATVSITGWITNIPMGMVNMTGLPSEISAVSGQFFSVLDGNDGVGGTSYSGSPTGNAFTGSFPWHQTGERTVGRVSLGRKGEFPAITLFDSFSTNTLSQTVAAPGLLPWGQFSTVVSAALQKASWLLVPEPSAAPKGELLQMNWSRVVNNVSQQWQWFIIMPPGLTSVDFPALPAALSDHLPSQDDFLGGFMTVFDIPSVTNYDMLRTLPSANIMCLRCAIDAGDFQRVVMEQF